MNVKKLKKIVKRQTTERRALRQTARRRNQLTTGMNKKQIAQDIYRNKGAAGGKAAGSRGGGGYTLKKFSYNMFEYGDPLAAKGKSKTTARGKKGQRRTPRQAGKKAKLKKKNIFVLVD